MRRRLCIAALLALAAACSGPAGRGPLLAGLPQPGDAPYELADDDDLDSQRARLDTLAPGSQRNDLRNKLAAEYASRLRRALERSERDQCYANFMRLVGLWSAPEISAGAPVAVLAGYRDDFIRMRAMFARSGADHQTVGVLFVLAVIDPGRAEVYHAEVDEIFSYSDALNVAQYGDGAQRARPIALLEGVAQFFPSKQVSDRLIDLYIERQQAIADRIRRRGADFNLIRAHGAGVLRTAWKVVALLAKTDRLGEARRVLSRVSGLGDDPDLRNLVRRALRTNAKDRAWIDLANHFRQAEDDDSDLEAVLAILRHGLKMRPKSAAISLAAGNVAFELERIPLAVKYFEAGLTLDVRHRPSSERLATLYEAQVKALALGARVKAATEQLAVFEAFHKRARRVFQRPLKPDLADAYAAMGRGLANVGDLERSHRYLSQSVRERPTLAALEILGTIELKRDRHRAALSYFDQALKLPATNLEQHFHYNRILRLAGEAALGQHDVERAGELFAQTMERWERVLASYELSDELLGQLLLETGHIQWTVGQQESAVAAFNAALDAVPDDEDICSSIVAFLIGHGMYREALEAYHRALGNSNISEDAKIYMSLWLVAEANLSAREVDPFAAEFLALRSGARWQEALAKLGRGATTMAELKPMATTPRRQNELLFYSATLGDTAREPAETRRLLRRVEESNMILNFEHELAKRWLRRRLPMRPKN